MTGNKLCWTQKQAQVHQKVLISKNNWNTTKERLQIGIESTYIFPKTSEQPYHT